MSFIWKVVIMSVCAYFIGNISFARIISKAQGDDITKHGSGNPGATNMIRTHGARRGFLTFILDILKGAVCAVTAFFVCGGFNDIIYSSLALYIVGFFAVIGHIFPVIYKFKGGKGLATAAGVCFVANPAACILLMLIHWGTLYFFKLPASLMSLISATLFIILDTIKLCLLGQYYCLIILYALYILIVWAHRSNIKKLLERKESTLDLKAAFEMDRQRKAEKKKKISEEK